MTITRTERDYQVSLGELTDIDLCILLAIFTQGETVAETGIEEVYRRQLVALIRQAGTSIRKEELKRQALSAQVNLPGAEAVRGELVNALRLLSPSEFRGNIQNLTTDALGKHLAQWLKKIVVSLPNVPMPRLQNTIRALNAQIRVHNRIMGDLASEKIYVAELAEITEGQDYLSVVISLPQALDIANKVVGTFKGIAEFAEHESVLPRSHR